MSKKLSRHCEACLPVGREARLKQSVVNSRLLRFARNDGFDNPAFGTAFFIVM
jgi:hypothetical protein